MEGQEGIITVADRLRLYTRLSQHLSIPGRLDQALFMLSIQNNNMISPNSPPASLARVIWEQLELRIPARDYAVGGAHPTNGSIRNWPTSRLRSTPTKLSSSHLSPTDKIAILSPQIVFGLMIATGIAGRHLPVAGQGAAGSRHALGLFRILINCFLPLPDLVQPSPEVDPRGPTHLPVPSRAGGI